jgi:hypothetical protein
MPANLRYLSNMSTWQVKVPVFAAGVDDRLFKKYGRWKSDKAKDGYVKENIDVRLSVSKNLGL